MTFAAFVMFAADAVQVRKVGYWLFRFVKGKEVSRGVYSCGVAPTVCIPCDHTALAYVESSSLDHWQAVRVTEHKIVQSMINPY